MRFESVVLSVSWIPSEAVPQMTRFLFDVGLIRYDDPPPDAMHGFEAMLASDRFRFANELRAWAAVEDGRIVDAGYSGRGHINISTVHLGRVGVVFPAVGFPDIRRTPELASDAVTFVQTAGGRTGLPAPRRVHGRPFVRLAAPVVWTTLRLTISADGGSRGEIVGASPFPRHWVYDTSLQLAVKSGSMDFTSWYRESFGDRTPWGDTDSPAFAVEAETALERTVSSQIMRQGRKPRMRRVGVGESLVRQGDRGTELFLLLDGILTVEVDGEPVADVGPGAILGERALLEGGSRTSTLRAAVPCRVAVTSAADIAPEMLESLSRGHRREE